MLLDPGTETMYSGVCLPLVLFSAFYSVSSMLSLSSFSFDKLDIITSNLKSHSAVLRELSFPSSLSEILGRTFMACLLSPEPASMAGAGMLLAKHRARALLWCWSATPAYQNIRSETDGSMVTQRLTGVQLLKKGNEYQELETTNYKRGFPKVLCQVGYLHF